MGWTPTPTKGSVPLPGVKPKSTPAPKPVAAPKPGPNKKSVIYKGGSGSSSGLPATFASKLAPSRYSVVAPKPVQAPKSVVVTPKAPSLAGVGSVLASNAAGSLAGKLSVGRVGSVTGSLLPPSVVSKSPSVGSRSVAGTKATVVSGQTFIQKAAANVDPGNGRMTPQMRLNEAAAKAELDRENQKTLQAQTYFGGLAPGAMRSELRDIQDASGLNVRAVPDINTVLSDKVFDVNNSRVVSFTQKWAKDQGANIAVTGRWDNQTYSGLTEGFRLYGEAELKKQTELVGKVLSWSEDFKKQFPFLTSTQLTQQLLSGTATADVQSAFMRAYSEYQSNGGEAGKLSYYQDLYKQQRTQLIGTLTGLGGVDFSGYLTLPYALQTGDVGDIDKLVAQYEYQTRARKEMQTANYNAAGNSMAWWSPLKGAGSATMSALGFLSERVTAGMFGGDMKAYRAWKAEDPWVASALEAVNDPLNWVGVGTIGKTATVLRLGTKGFEIADDASRFARAMVAIDKGLAKAGDIKRARDLFAPVLKADGTVIARSAAARVVRKAGSATHDALEGVINLHPASAHVYQRVIDLSRALTATVGEAKTAVRMNWNQIVRSDLFTQVYRAAQTVPGEGLRTHIAEYLGADALRLYESVPDKVWAEWGEKCSQNTLRLTTAMTSQMPDLVKNTIERYKCRIFYDNGVPTVYGARLQAQLKDEAFIEARRTMISDGRANPSEFSDSHFVPVSPSRQAEFNTYLKRYEDLIDSALLPSLNHLAFAAGYGFDLADDVAAAAKGLLLPAMDDMVKVFNPAHVAVADFKDEAERAAYSDAVRRNNDLRKQAAIARREFKKTGDMALSDEYDRLLERAGAVALGDEDGYAALVKSLGAVRARMKDVSDVEYRVLARSEADILKRMRGYASSARTPIATPRSRMLASAQRMTAVSQEVGDSLADIRSLTRRLAGESKGLDAESYASLRDEVLPQFQQRIVRWEQSAREIAAGGLDSESRAALARISKTVSGLEGDVKFWEAGLADAADVPPEELAKRVEKRLADATERYTEATKEFDRLTAQDAADVGVGIRSGGPRQYSEKEVGASIEAEQRRLKNHYERYDKTRQALGFESDSSGRLLEAMQGVQDSWREIKPGCWVNDRAFIEVPRLYVHGAAQGNEWIDAGLGLRDSTRLELRGAFMGFDPSEGVDKAFSYGVEVDRGALRRVSDAEAVLDRAKRALVEGEARGLSGSERTALLREKLSAEENLGRVRRGETVARARGSELSLTDEIGRVQPDMVSKSREATRAMHGRVNPDDALQAEFVSALKERMDYMSGAEASVRPHLYKAEMMYMRALEHYQVAPVRIAYKSIAAGTNVWKFCALPLRFGWVVGNVLDNAVKCILAGLRDPRYLMLQTTHVFAMKLNPLRGAVALLDRLTGTTLLQHFDTVLAHVFDLDKGYLARICALENIPIPGDVTEGTFAKFFAGGDARSKGMQGALWSMMGNGPEELFRKALYRDVYAKTLKLGGAVEDAMRAGIDEVNRILFDYTNPTVLEDNLKLFLPFVQFWRKNAVLWPQLVMDNPWFMADLNRWNSTLEAVHNDKPSWMQRYLSLDPVGDFLAGWKGTSWLAGAFKDKAFDPLDMFSFAPLYRAFKSSNQNLTDSESGLAFFGAMFDSFDKYGLGMNPLIRKPLEWFGVITPEFWRSAFPQNDLIKAITSQLAPERFPHGLDLEAWIAEPVFQAMSAAGLNRESPRQFDNRSYEEYVQLEIARQIERGEAPDLAKAQETIRNYTAAIAICGYFTRVYGRQMSPEDIALAKAVEDGINKGWDDSLFANNPGLEPYLRYLRQKKNPDGAEGPADAAAFAKWAEVEGIIGAYQRVPYEKRTQYLREHPEIAPYIIPAWSKVSPLSDFYRKERLAHDTELVSLVSRDMKTMGGLLTADQKSQIIDFFKTPELEAYWAKNDTPEDKALQYAQNQTWLLYDQLNAAFHSLPSDDYKAQQSFLDANPTLELLWSKYASLDTGSVLERAMNVGNAQLRNMWGVLTDGKHYAAADAFLAAHPFMFENTKAKDKVSYSGEWFSKLDVHARTTYEAWASEHVYEAVQLHFWSKFYSLPVGEREAFLQEFGVRYGYNPYTQEWGAQLSRDAYSRLRADAQKVLDGAALAYAKVEPLLMRYLGLPESMRAGYLAEHPMLGAYFAKYGSSSRGTSARARAYMAVKSQLDAYFAITDKGRRAAYLKAHPQVQRYFDKYGKHRSHGSSARGRAYMAVKSQLDAYFAITDEAHKILYLEMHPEVQKYFSTYGKRLTDNPALNKLLAEYYALPMFSQARKAFLAKHSEVGKYFDAHPSSDPKTAAIHDLLEIYFSLSGALRKNFGALHPEIGQYFDERNKVKASLTALRKEHDMSMPWLAESYARFAALYFGEAEIIRQSLGRKAANMQRLTRRGF